MQIVIDINDKLYDRIKYLEPTADTMLDKLMKSVQNGTPLPKGHGKLIDVNDLLDRIGLENNDRNREDNVGEIVTLEDFDFTPTIIDAESEDNNV